MLRKIFAVAIFGIVSLQAEVYELRTYVAKEGKIENLLTRFRDHTCKLFEKHGMKNIGYWTSADNPGTLIYVISHKDRETAKANWAAFQKDPDWVKAKTESEANGPILEKITSVFMNPTDFSKLK